MAVFVELGRVAHMEGNAADGEGNDGFKMRNALGDLPVPVAVHVGVVRREDAGLDGGFGIVFDEWGKIEVA